MSGFDTRGALLRTSAAAALLALGATGASASTVVGGGSTLAGPTYQKIFNDKSLATPPTYTCTTSVDICYALVGSGGGTTGFLNNDSTKLSLAAGIPVDFGGSDAVLSGAQITAFQTTNGYQLIQIPAFGTPITIPFKYAGKTKNAAIKLKDSDLCGIFSGNIKRWQDTSATGVTGNIAVVYRQDSSGTSFLLTNHLAAVCPSGILPGGGSFVGTTKFAQLFPGYSSSGRRHDQLRPGWHLRDGPPG